MSETATEDDTKRKTVVTYVPPHQKARWKNHAEELDMSQAEFVRTMVQAGRKGFDISREPTNLEGASTPTDPGGNDLETRILETLEKGGVSSWDELISTLSANFEDRLESTLESLQRENEIRYSGREGGYTVVTE